MYYEYSFEGETRQVKLSGNDLENLWKIKLNIYGSSLAAF
jgi:hypothetical protein